MNQSRENGSVLPYIYIVAIKKGAFESFSTMVANLYIYIYIYIYICIYEVGSKYSKPYSERKAIAELFFVCGNTLTILIKSEKTIHISVLISMLERSIER